MTAHKMEMNERKKELRAMLKQLRRPKRYANANRWLRTIDFHTHSMRTQFPNLIATTFISIMAHTLASSSSRCIICAIISILVIIINVNIHTFRKGRTVQLSLSQHASLGIGFATVDDVAVDEVEMVVVEDGVLDS